MLLFFSTTMCAAWRDRKRYQRHTSAKPYSWIDSLGRFWFSRHSLAILSPFNWQHSDHHSGASTLGAGQAHWRMVKIAKKRQNLNGYLNFNKMAPSKMLWQLFSSPPTSSPWTSTAMQVARIASCVFTKFVAQTPLELVRFWSVFFQFYEWVSLVNNVQRSTSFNIVAQFTCSVGC